MSLTIRRAQPADAHTVIAGINAIAREGGAFHITHFVPAGQWEKVLFNPGSAPNCRLLIAESASRFAGALRLFPGASHTFYRHVGEIGMFVLPPFRRQGIGAQLLTAALAWAEEAGLEKITLSVFATNQPALHLYRKFGFIEEGCQRKQIKIDDVYINSILMGFFLNANFPA